MAKLLTGDSEARIDANGIFVSCFQGQTLLWEFHPDDVTSIGTYSEDGCLREVIVAVIHDFDVPEGTRGFKELNERLSRELKTEIRVDIEHGVSPLGVVLWPPHLAGNPLWEFFVIEAGGFFRGVSRDTPNALRELYQPLRREMRRNAKPHLPSEFPQSLIDRGFAYRGEIGWVKDDALLAAEWLRNRGAAIVDAELWLVKNAVIQPHIQTASGIASYRYSTTPQPSETWDAFANRALNVLKAFVHEFQWPENTTESAERQERFRLTWDWKDLIEDDGYRFPK
jgi:hypothetical protein